MPARPLTGLSGIACQHLHARWIKEFVRLTKIAMLVMDVVLQRTALPASVCHSLTINRFSH